jgi:hypothetical protein
MKVNDGVRLKLSQRLIALFLSLTEKRLHKSLELLRIGLFEFSPEPLVLGARFLFQLAWLLRFGLARHAESIARSNLVGY